tara:strand:- start:188 stop:547 length:360 start_codon:yes stop_codon:yes gene_type:complete
MMMEAAMATEATLSPRARTDAFLNKLSQPVKTMTTEVKPKVAPPKKIEVIPLKDYVADAKTRWKVHTLHFSEFVEDCQWVIEKSKPYVTKAIDKTKELVKSANTWIEKTQSKNEKDHTG